MTEEEWLEDGEWNPDAQIRLQSDLVWAVRRGDLAAITELVAEGASLDTMSYASVADALAYGQGRLVPALAELGAQVTAQDFERYFRHYSP